MLITPGDLMYTHLFSWQGQDGTPTWKQLLNEYNCTEYLDYYLWHMPPVHPVEPPPFTPPFTPPIEPPVITPYCVVGCGPTVPNLPATPEPATWMMMGIGFLALVVIARRRYEAAAR